MAPPVLSLALPSETGRVLSIQSHTVQGNCNSDYDEATSKIHCLHASKTLSVRLKRESGTAGAIEMKPHPVFSEWEVELCWKPVIKGYVGNKSAVFPLQLLGYDVDPTNSVQFSNHTGYPTFKGQVLNGEQLWQLIEGLEANELLHYSSTNRCYIGSVSFLNTVLEVVKKLRSINPKLTYEKFLIYHIGGEDLVCDPVLGDEGKLYVPPELVAVYREKVIPVASMLTPNQFEAEQLTGFRIVSEQDGRDACNYLHAAGPSKVVITSITIDGTLLLIDSHLKEKGQSPDQFKIVIPKIPAYFTGTGDLTTALLLGWSNKYPEDLDKAAELAVSSIQALLRRTMNDYEAVGYDPQSSSLEIRLIQSQEDIRNPEVKLKADKYN